MKKFIGGLLVLFIFLGNKSYAQKLDDKIISIKQFYESNNCRVVWNSLDKSADVYFKDKLLKKYKIDNKNSFIKEGVSYTRIDNLDNSVLTNKVSAVYPIYSIKESKKYPNLLLIRDGEMTKFSDKAKTNSIDVVIFWANWCHNCDDVLSFLGNKYIEKDNINLITICIDDMELKAEGFPIFRDGKSIVFDSYKAKYVPSMYVNDKSQGIQLEKVGKDEILEYLKTIY